MLTSLPVSWDKALWDFYFQACWWHCDLQLHMLPCLLASASPAPVCPMSSLCRCHPWSCPYRPIDWGKQGHDTHPPGHVTLGIRVDKAACYSPNTKLPSVQGPAPPVHLHGLTADPLQALWTCPHIFFFGGGGLKNARQHQLSTCFSTYRALLLQSEYTTLDPPQGALPLTWSLPAPRRPSQLCRYSRLPWPAPPLCFCRDFLTCGHPRVALLCLNLALAKN